MFVLLDVNERLAWICPKSRQPEVRFGKECVTCRSSFLPRIESIEDTVKPPDLNIDHAPKEQKILNLNNVRQRRGVTIKTSFSTQHGREPVCITILILYTISPVIHDSILFIN